MSANSLVVFAVPAANGVSPVVDVSLMGSRKTILVDGDFDAILNIEASADGVNFAPVKTVQGGGLVSMLFAAVSMRVRVSGYRNGSPTVAVAGPRDGTEAVTLAVPAGNGSGASSPISNFGSVGTVFVTTEFGGSLIVEASNDDVDWSPVTTFQGPGIAVVNLTAGFMRVKRSGVGFNPGLPVVSYVAANDSSSGVFPPPFTEEVITIYARTTGDDETGNGTLINPYRTMVRAVQDVPYIIPAGTRYVVDITDLGIEVLPENYTFPPWKAAQWIDLDFASFYYPRVTAVAISADPQPYSGVPLADTIIDALDILSVVQDPVTTLSTLTLNVARASWAADALKGRFLIGAAPGGAFEHCVITASTNTTIEFTDNFAPTTPMQVMEPSAELQGSNSADAFGRGAVSILGVDSIGLWGLRIENMTAFYTSVWSQTAMVQNFTLCDLVSGFDLEGGSSFSAAFNCWIHGLYIQIGSQFRVNRSLMDGLSAIITTSYGASEQGWNRDVFDTCPSVGTAVDASFQANTAQFTVLHLTRVLFRDSVGDAIAFSGGRGTLIAVGFENPVGNAISAIGPGLLELFDFFGGIEGTGIGGVALVLDDGAQARVTAGVFTNLLVDAMVVGDLGSRLFDDFRNGVGGVMNNQYDITAVAATGATGTGSRAFQS